MSDIKGDEYNNLKRAITGIVAAGLALGMMAPAAFAATTTSSTVKWNTVKITAGSYTAAPEGFAGYDHGSTTLTTFAPVYYVQQALNALGYTVTWDGSNLHVTTPAGVTPDLSGISVGTGDTGIYVNGTLVKNVYKQVQKDPLGGKSAQETTYVPIFYIDALLKAAGENASWNGSGWTMPALSAAVTGVKTVAANKVEVDFSKPVDTTKAQLALNFGYVPQDVTVAFAADGKSATLTSANALTAGNYTVAVNGLGLATTSYALTVAAEKLADFSITTNVLAAGSSNDINYSAVDQYGNTFSYASTNFTVSAFDATTGSALTVAQGTGKFTITSAVALNDKVVVTVVDTASGKSHTVNYTVGTTRAVANVTLSAPQPYTGTTRIQTSDTTGKLVLPITFTDQYGTAVTPAASLWAAAGAVEFISSDTSIVDPASFAVDGNNNVTFSTGAKAGTVTITAISKSTGQSASVTFTVSAPAALNSVQFQQPAGLVVATEPTTVNYTATDSYGASTLLKNASDLTWFSTDSTIVNPATDIAVDSKGNLTVTPENKAGTVTLSAFLNGVKQGDIVLDVQAAAVPTKITGLASTTPTFFDAASGTYTYSAADLNVVDQYNRPVKTSALTGAVTVAVKDASTSVFATSGAAVTAAATGSKVVTITYTQGAITLTRDVTMTAIADSSVVKYELADLGVTTLASGSGTKTIAIKDGLDAAGDHVALSAADAAAFYLTTSNSAVASVSGATVTAGTVTSDTQATVGVWKNGSKIQDVAFTVSAAPAAIQSLKWDSTVTYAVTGTATLDVSGDVSGTDQYGATVVVGNAGANGQFFSSNPAVATVNPNTGVVTGVAKGTTTITFVAKNGVSASVTFTVN